jgi:hypothetical protein
MEDVVFDAGPLITSCKYEVDGRLVIDCIFPRIQVNISESVRDEVVVAGSRFRDAREAGKRILNGDIKVLKPPSVPSVWELLKPYNLGAGEQDSILLLSLAGLEDASLIVDDHLAYLVSRRLGNQTMFLLDLIVQMANDGILVRELAIKLTKAIQSRYPVAFVEHSLMLLQRLQ